MIWAGSAPSAGGKRRRDGGAARRHSGVLLECCRWIHDPRFAPQPRPARAEAPLGTTYEGVYMILMSCEQGGSAYTKGSCLTGGNERDKEFHTAELS